MAAKSNAIQEIQRKPLTRHPGVAPWLQGVACGVLFILATPTAVLGMLLLLPTLLAMLAERQPGKPVSRAVLLFGLAAATVPFTALWHGDHSVADVWALVADVRAVAIDWSAQAAGWLLTQALPLLINLAGDARANIEAGRLHKRREALVQEWHSSD